MKVLVVDNSEIVRTLVAKCTNVLGHEIFYAKNGEQAIRFVEEKNIDLALIDVEMPGIGGFKTTYAIRAMEDVDWFPIIFITTKTDDDSFANGILSGGDAYVQKPISALRLQLTITAMLRIYVMHQKLQKTQKELLAANKELEQFALFDKLTGLANRRNFDETLKQQYQLAKRNKDPLTFIICDIDFFKLYNDHYGHQEGDECLASVAKAIGSIPNRPTDKTCRYGGEEFTIILPDTDLVGGEIVAEKLKQAVLAVKIKHEKSTASPFVTLSLGIATYIDDQFKTPEELVKAADDALYAAKKNGRNRIEKYIKTEE